MADLVERAARATFAAWRGHMLSTGEPEVELPRDFDSLNQREREFAFANAKATIEAIAAPDMLAALEGIATAYLGDCPAAQDELAHAMGHIQYLRNKAHDAIAKATGAAQ